MKLRKPLPFPATLLLSLLTVRVRSQSDGLVQEYCSSENTGSSYDGGAGVVNIYQSNGACKTTCQASYAFAIVQNQTCWCSDYIPASQVAVSNCDETCPGYPSDLCGNAAAGLFGYIALTVAPSGTAGASTTSTTSSTTTSTTSTTTSTTTPSSSTPGTTSTSVSTNTPWRTLPTDRDADIIIQIRNNSPSSSLSSTLLPSTTSSNPIDVAVYTHTYYTASFTSTSTSTSASSSSASPTTDVLTNSLQTSTSSTSSSSTTQLQTSIVGSPVVQTVTQSQDATTVVSYVTLTPVAATTSTTTAATTTSPSASSTESSSSTAQVVESVQVITVSGAIITQTVTSAPIGSAQDADTAQVQEQGLSAGSVAGIVIGVVAGILILALAAFLLWRRRKRVQAEERAGAMTGGATTGEKGPVKRNTSVLSRSGLLARINNDHNETNPFDEPASGGTASQRHSMLFGAGMMAGEGVSPNSPLETTSSNDSRRHSKPLVYDQRLNPSALFGAHDNGSRVSMQDGADYSRTLGVTNPDTRTSWESRISHG